MLRFGASFEDKIAYVPFVFLCRFDILRSAHHGNCTSSEQKWTLSLYREKGGEEKEGERRLWERCVNRLRFSTVSIAAAREKRERRLAAALLLSLFSLKIRDYSASLLGVTGRKSS